VEAAGDAEGRLTGDGSRRWWLTGAAIATVAVVAIGLAAVWPSSHRATPAPAPKPARLIRPAVVVRPAPPPPIPARTTIATVTGALPYFAAPGGRQVGTIPIDSWWGLTKELPVVATAPGWLDVRLPQRPNGLTGWIHASDARLSSTLWGIYVDLHTRRVVLYHAGHAIGIFPAGIGTIDDPTPTGHFYVMVIEPSEGPGWGPFIIGTNAHSNAILSWEGSGDAFTALHGPLGMDAAIGTTGAMISHGCIRMHDADLARLAPVPLGAPVVIVG
jgi:hypothetical protein